MYLRKGEVPVFLDALESGKLLAGLEAYLFSKIFAVDLRHSLRLCGDIKCLGSELVDAASDTEGPRGTTSSLLGKAERQETHAREKIACKVIS